MAYSNAQRKQHIYELQTYLHAIALMNSKIPLIIPDGTYGKTQCPTAICCFSVSEVRCGKG